MEMTSNFLNMNPCVLNTQSRIQAFMERFTQTLNRMKLAPCIQSLAELDLYKLTMMQMFQHQHPDVVGEYRFKNRTKTAIFTPAMLDEINAQLDYVSMLRFTEDEIDYLHTIRFLKYDFVESLRNFYPRREHITATLTEDGVLEIKVVGPVYLASMWEIYTLAIVNEVYFRMTYGDEWEAIMKDADDRLTEKIRKFKNGTWKWRFTDFGLRRRLCREWHERMIFRLLDESIRPDPVTGELLPAIAGTSNVYLAYLAWKKRYNLPAAGTCAHESIQLYQGIKGIDPAFSNRYMLRDWYAEYHGDLGTALTDTIGTDVFLLDIGLAEAQMLSGYRHDSGDPYKWGDTILMHLEQFRARGVKPEEKLLLFSNGLNGDEANAIYKYFGPEGRKCKVGFGIGTWFTNDTEKGSLNIVLKLQKVGGSIEKVSGQNQLVGGRNVAKLSDDTGKTMSLDPSDVEHLQRGVVWRLARESQNFNPEKCLSTWVKPWLDAHGGCIA